MNSLPPPLPAAVRRQRTLRRLAWTAGALTLVVALGWGGLWSYWALKSQTARETSNADPGSELNLKSGAGTTIAGQPIIWPTNSATVADERRRGREFRERQYLEAYLKNPGPANAARRQAGEALIARWIAENYDDGPQTNRVSASELAADYLGAAGPAHPLALIAAGASSANLEVQAQLYRQALRSYPDYPGLTAYPRFFVSVRLAEHPGPVSDGRPSHADCVALFGELLRDGGVRNADQEELANVMFSGWAKEFTQTNLEALSALRSNGGDTLRWFAHIVAGKLHEKAGWAARGSGFVNTVTEQGWQDFRRHMSQARQAYTAAWELKPQAVLAPASMVGVAMAAGEAEEMRLWFDRACAAQADSGDAWHHLRWGLRPRWHGSAAAMLALGRAAVDTGRFDTDVPRRLFDCITDLESEANLPLGEHLYGHPEVWPLLARMYGGYVGQYPDNRGWRTTFATVAHLAGHDEVAREQLEAIQWSPWRDNLVNWGRDLSLLPEQVAAFSGPHGDAVRKAEQEYQDEQLDEALKGFRRLLATLASDRRSLAFAESRFASIQSEQRLLAGDWVSLLPHATDDPAWEARAGELRQTDSTGAIVANSPIGHLITSRIRVGGNFSVRAEIELPLTAGQLAEAGVNFGIPELGGERWQAIRIRRRPDGRDEAAINLAWTRYGSVRPAKLNDGINLLEVNAIGETVTVLVNGTEVLSHIAYPHNFGVPAARVVLGLGGESNSAGTLVRYRRFDVKRL